jgi:hypothetical protein
VRHSREKGCQGSLRSKEVQGCEVRRWGAQAPRCRKAGGPEPGGAGRGLDLQGAPDLGLGAAGTPAPPRPCPLQCARESRGGARGLARGEGSKRVIKRGPETRDAALGAAGAAARMAPTRRPAGARLLLVCAGLLAAAAVLGAPESGAPAGNRARPEPPGTELPAGRAESPPVRRGAGRRLPSGRWDVGWLVASSPTPGSRLLRA